MKLAIADPPSASAPLQRTVKSGSSVSAGSAATLLVGLPASRVWKIAGVSIGSSVSKTMRASASITVPVATLRLALTV